MSIAQFFHNTKAEMKHVHWPSRQHTIVFTAVVIVVSLVVGYLLGAFDMLFQAILKTILF
ncbi:MAG TPA: preprotein translocase subunit SecE [Candidatus Paceibacterota bacterium]|nr:preprotein translocase subunit SecE [Candidatus Paceibacterota bacterium]